MHTALQWKQSFQPMDHLCRPTDCNLSFHYILYVIHKYTLCLFIEIAIAWRTLPEFGATFYDLHLHFLERMFVLFVHHVWWVKVLFDSFYDMGSFSIILTDVHAPLRIFIWSITSNDSLNLLQTCTARKPMWFKADFNEILEKIEQFFHIFRSVQSLGGSTIDLINWLTDCLYVCKLHSRIRTVSPPFYDFWIMVYEVQFRAHKKVVNATVDISVWRICLLSK